MYLSALYNLSSPSFWMLGDSPLNAWEWPLFEKDSIHEVRPGLLCFAGNVLCIQYILQVKNMQVSACLKWLLPVWRGMASYVACYSFPPSKFRLSILGQRSVICLCHSHWSSIFFDTAINTSHNTYERWTPFWLPYMMCSSILCLCIQKHTLCSVGLTPR